MGKKSNHVSKKRTEKKDKGSKNLEPITRTHVVNLHKRLYKQTFKKKAPNAVKSIKEQAEKELAQFRHV